MFISDHEPSVAATETALATTDGLIVSGTTNGAADAAIANPLATITVPCKGVLRQYLDASPECVELFTLWERAGAAATNRLAAAVMKVLACVLRYGTPALRVAQACVRVVNRLIHLEPGRALLSRVFVEGAPLLP